MLPRLLVAVIVHGCRVIHVSVAKSGPAAIRWSPKAPSHDKSGPAAIRWLAKHRAKRAASHFCAHRALLARRAGVQVPCVVQRRNAGRRRHQTLCARSAPAEGGKFFRAISAFRVGVIVSHKKPQAVKLGVSFCGRLVVN